MDSLNTPAKASGSQELVQWQVPGRDSKQILFCDRELMTTSGFKEKYHIKRYIHAGWYSRICEAQDRQDYSRWALKIVNKNLEHTFARLDWDLNNLKATKGEPSIVQEREHFDFGSTTVIVLELADGDLQYSWKLLANIKDDQSFKVLARQLLESVDALDRHGICHSPCVFDFLYFKKEGRVKVSALERGSPVTRDNQGNIKALEAVWKALDTAAKNVESLSHESEDLLVKLGAVMPSAEYWRQLEYANNLGRIVKELKEKESSMPKEELIKKAKAIQQERVANLQAKEQARPKPCAQDLLEHEAVAHVPPGAKLIM